MMKLAKAGFQIALFVRDMKSALDFYQDTLGLESKGRDENYTLGAAIHLKCGDSSLLLIEPETKTPAGPSWVHAQMGFRYVVFFVENLSEICEKLQEKKVKFTIHETKITSQLRIAMIQDPDGNNIQFIERR
ncbi:MAG: VOC family protein [Deltaproteobacteria bacterium]|nr:VOC family protein [Deltaproteobacteria bacterium]